MHRANPKISKAWWSVDNACIKEGFKLWGIICTYLSCNVTKCHTLKIKPEAMRPNAFPFNKLMYSAVGACCLPLGKLVAYLLATWWPEFHESLCIPAHPFQPSQFRALEGRGSGGYLSQHPFWYDSACMQRRFCPLYCHGYLPSGSEFAHAP